MTPDNSVEDKVAEKLHNWYLEAVKEISPESFNPLANKPYSELTDEQKSIDRFIAAKVSKLLTEARIDELKLFQLSDDLDDTIKDSV